MKEIRVLGKCVRGNQITSDNPTGKNRPHKDDFTTRLSLRTDYAAMFLPSTVIRSNVRTCNAGQALPCKIASAERAAITAETLLSERMFSDWGSSHRSFR